MIDSVKISSEDRIMQEDFASSTAEFVQSSPMHPGYKHWFWKWFALGDFNPLTLQRFALLYYEHVKRFPGYFSRAGSIVLREDLQQAMNGILADELGQTGAPSHPEMFCDFMRSLGLTERNWNRDHLIPGIRHFQPVPFDLFHSERQKESLAALIFALESPTPHRYRHFVKGLSAFRERNGTEVDVTFFSSHVEIAPYHQASLLDPIASWLRIPEKHTRMLDGICCSFDAREVFLDNLAHVLSVTDSFNCLIDDRSVDSREEEVVSETVDLQTGGANA